MRHIRFAFLKIPLRRNRCPISFGIESASIHDTPKMTPSQEMYTGLQYAHWRLNKDFYSPATRCKNLPYLTPVLAHVLHHFHLKSPKTRPIRRLVDIAILNEFIQHEFTEDPAKYFGGLYSLSEACTLVVAGMCGPESPLWNSKPRRQEMTVEYKFSDRTDILHFHRDYETDGDWLIANINEIIQPSHRIPA